MRWNQFGLNMSGEGQTEEYSTVNSGKQYRAAVYIAEKLSKGGNFLQQPFMDMFRFSLGWVQGEHTREDLQTSPLYTINLGQSLHFVPFCFRADAVNALHNEDISI